MKKYLFFFACLFAASTVAFAENDDVLRYDEVQIQAEFGRLNALEKHVTTHEGITLEDVKAHQAQLTEGIELETNAIASVMAATGEMPANIPPFWWGFCLGWVGLLLVYILTDNDRDQVKKAFTGCLISTGIIVLFYVILWGLVLGNVAWLGSGI